MDPQQVSKQLNIMVAFIDKEAKEKANEIKTKTEEEYTIEKAKLVQAQKQKITQEFERKEKQVEVSKKIAHSNELSACRLQVLKAREAGVNKILETARSRLEQLSKGSTYKDLLVDLIVQGLYRLNETDVEVRFREEDKHLVEEAYLVAAEKYTHKTGKKVRLTLNHKQPLPPSPSRAGPKALATCSGGVILGTPGGKIVCNNTLDVRLQYSFEAAVPAIRAKLFTVDVI
uniref:V-type proton ATPase subunit E n=1 Tax=Arcella intermedia TaxID=1963864 RepID=A0A6B2LH75_9EUKA